MAQTARNALSTETLCRESSVWRSIRRQKTRGEGGKTRGREERGGRERGEGEERGRYEVFCRKPSTTSEDRKKRAEREIRVDWNGDVSPEGRQDGLVAMLKS